MHILLTRPIDDCKELIIKFKSLGHKVSHLPVISINPIDYLEPNIKASLILNKLYNIYLM